MGLLFKHFPPPCPSLTPFPWNQFFLVLNNTCFLNGQALFSLRFSSPPPTSLLIFRDSASTTINRNLYDRGCTFSLMNSPDVSQIPRPSPFLKPSSFFKPFNLPYIFPFLLFFVALISFQRSFPPALCVPVECDGWRRFFFPNIIDVLLLRHVPPSLLFYPRLGVLPADVGYGFFTHPTNRRWCAGRTFNKFINPPHPLIFSPNPPPLFILCFSVEFQPGPPLLDMNPPSTPPLSVFLSPDEIIFL